MNAADLVQIAKARELCVSGGLRMLREHRGLSTGDLAAAVSAELGRRVHGSTVSRWERAERLPGAGHALGLFRAVAALAAEGDD